MKTLLNKLIDMWWKPWGYEWETSVIKTKRDWKWIEFEKYADIGFSERAYITYHIRELVSKESWLWQYVCSRSLIKINDEVWIKHINDTEKDYDRDCWIYEYRLIESSLRDESELEDFLLSNIKID